MPLNERIALEVCIDTAAGLSACHGLVDRVELCYGLELGGLTPSAGLMQAAQQSGIETHVLIRPRTGDFSFDNDTLTIALHDIRHVKSLGLKGVVIGAIKEGALDSEAMEQMCATAEGLQVTLHRAFDVVTDRPRAMEDAIALGISRILTSGGAVTAHEGRMDIAQINRSAADRIEIMAGSGVNCGNVRQIIAETGISAVHSSCAIQNSIGGHVRALGFGEISRTTDRNEIKRLRDVLDNVGTA